MAKEREREKASETQRERDIYIYIMNGDSVQVLREMANVAEERERE